MKAERKACLCEMHLDDTAMSSNVIFKYRPRRWLIAKGFIEEPPEEIDEDEVQIDTRRTERVAAMKRARKQADQARRNIQVRHYLDLLYRPTLIGLCAYLQVKRELSIKTETTITDSQMPNRNEDILDLTLDGDFVLPSRQIGDTIKVEDDSDDDF
jgi:hypothetical protein